MPSHLNPIDVVVGEPSHLATISKASECVKMLMEDIGPLEAWNVKDATGATQVTAIFRFGATEDAREHPPKSMVESYISSAIPCSI